MITLIANLPAAVGQWKGRRFPLRAANSIDYFLRTAMKEIRLSTEGSSRATSIFFMIASKLLYLFRLNSDLINEKKKSHAYIQSLFLLARILQ